GSTASELGVPGRLLTALNVTALSVVLDNLREGVLTADIYDPTLNPLYRDVLSPPALAGERRKMRCGFNATAYSVPRARTARWYAERVARPVFEKVNAAHSSADLRIVRFGVFELDLATAQLRKSGI